MNSSCTLWISFEWEPKLSCWLETTVADSEVNQQSANHTTLPLAPFFVFHSFSCVMFVDSFALFPIFVCITYILCFFSAPVLYSPAFMQVFFKSCFIFTPLIFCFVRCCLAPQGSGRLDAKSSFSVSQMAWWSRRFWWRFWGKGPGREGAAAKSFRSWLGLTQIRMPKIQHGFQFQTSLFSLLALRVPNMSRRPRFHVTKLHRKGLNIFCTLGNSAGPIEGFDHGFVLEPSSWGALEESSSKDRAGQMFQLWRVFKGHQTQTPWSNENQTFLE